MAITEGDKQFCVEYASSRNAVRAYMRTHPGTCYTAASTASSRLLKSLEIRQEVDAIRRCNARQAKIDAVRVLRELAAIAHFDPGDVFEDHEGSPSPRAWSTIDPMARRVISKIKIKRRRLCAGPKSTDDKTSWEVEEVEYSFCSKLDALDKLCRHLGITKDGAALEQLLKVLQDPTEGTELSVKGVTTPCISGG